MREDKGREMAGKGTGHVKERDKGGKDRETRNKQWKGKIELNYVRKAL